MIRTLLRSCLLSGAKQQVLLTLNVIVEAHVRCYVISRYEVNGVVKFRTDAMRLSKPDDEVGSTLLMNLPSIVGKLTRSSLTRYTANSKNTGFNGFLNSSRR